MSERVPENIPDRSINEPIGVFYTPYKWAEWVITKFEIFDSWLNGATIFDPTAGEGIFLEVLIDLAISQGIKITDEMLTRLWANEIQTESIDYFLNKINKRDLDFPPANFLHSDILFLSQALQVDIIVGNPPWQNFNNLCQDYKQKLKPLFYKYGLVNKPQDLLLGSSRIDLAALIIAKTLQENLKPNGKAYFFMPLSVFLNDGAGRGFRSYQVNQTEFCVQQIYDFKNLAIFEHVHTRYGLVEFQRDRQQEFPIKYFIQQKSEWQEYQARPLFQRNESLTILKSAEEYIELQNCEKIKISKDSKPRQGANSCGASDVFIFSALEVIDRELVRVANKIVGEITLPQKFLFPLITKQNFQQAQPIPDKYILLPYDRERGKPLLATELIQYPELWQYLQCYQEILQNRRGTLIQSSIRKGFWYALLGVGKYTFTAYKVVWQAYGQKNFAAKLFDGNWQGNQAIHAYIPVNSKAEGEDLIDRLNMPIVEKYLHSLQMEGTCNWAQPGRIMRLLEIV